MADGTGSRAPPALAGAYDEIAAMPFAELVVDGAAALAEAEPRMADVAAALAKARDRYVSGDGAARAAVLRIVGDAPLDERPVFERTRELEVVLLQFYRDYGIGTAFDLSKERMHLVRVRADAPLWFWATVYAHLLLVEARLAAEPLAPAAAALVWRHAFFVAAKFAGPSFVPVVRALAAAHRGLDIAPAGFAPAVAHFLALLDAEFGGRVDPSWHW